MERILKQFINTIIFPLLFAVFCAVVLTACLNPTGVDTIDRVGYVLVKVDRYRTLPCLCLPGPPRPSRITGGNQVIHGLCPNRYYMVEIQGPDGPAGFWFVRPDGVMVDSLQEIGWVRVNDATNRREIHSRERDGMHAPLTNDHSYLHIVHQAMPLTGYVSYFDVFFGLAIPRPVGSRPMEAKGSLLLPARGSFPYYFGYVLTPSPSVTYPARPALAFTAGITSYEVVRILFPGDTLVPGLQIPLPALTNITPTFGLYAGIHNAPPMGTQVDYIFVSNDAHRRDFYVLRVIPKFAVAMIVEALVIPDLSPYTEPYPIEVNQYDFYNGITIYLGVLNPYDFTNHRWEDDHGSVWFSEMVTLDFAEAETRRRHGALGRHIFSFSGRRENAEWSARVELYIYFDD